MQLTPPMPTDNAVAHATEPAEVDGAASRLAFLEFSDLYLEPDGAAWYKSAPDDSVRNTLEGPYLEDVVHLRAQLLKHAGSVDFLMDIQGVRLRVQCISTVDGDVYVCRRAAKTPMPVERLGYPSQLIKTLLSDAFTGGGLILFTGATGSGKSTSLASILAARLKLFGGVAWTAENPVETLLHGTHGSGVCYQTEVPRDEDFGIAIQRMLRGAPNIIVIGEIRSAKAAAQAALAGTSGHLVLSTLHANDIQSALQRLKNMLVHEGLDGAFLGDAMGAVLHQSMSYVRTPEHNRRVVTVSPLIVAGSRNATAIRAHMRGGEFHQLSSEIERQKRVLLMPGQAGGML